jgi:hypothetical protein
VSPGGTRGLLVILHPCMRRRAVNEMKTLLAIAILGSSVCAFLLISEECISAEPEPHPVSKMMALSRLTFIECSLTMQIELIQVQSDAPLSKYTKCVSSSKAKVKEAFQSARRQVNGRSLEMTKDFYAFWLSAIEGLVPGSGEVKFAYNNRVRSMEAELSQRQKRIEVELDLD